MTGIYMVSAQKPTAVTHSVLGKIILNFISFFQNIFSLINNNKNIGRVTSPTDLNLIICKSTLIEIYKVTAEGLKFVKQIGLWGVVENLNIIKLKVSLIFI